MTTAEERIIPPYADLTWEQHAGRSCVYCDRPLQHGAREVGRVRRDYGVPLRDVPVYAGPCCLGTDSGRSSASILREHCTDEQPRTFIGRPGMPPLAPGAP